MKTVRQDAWTVEDDRLLADVVLRKIRDGGTQLQGFAEVGQRLGRTAAACGYRWNAIVRKRYQAQIEVAKEERRARKEVEPVEAAVDQGVGDDVEKEELTWQEVLKFLRGQKGEAAVLGSRLKQVEKELEGRQEACERLEEENREVRGEIGRLERELGVMREDYVVLMGVMERARRMVVLGESEGDEGEEEMRFKMEENGNLERME